MSKYVRTKNNIYLIRKDISYGGNKIYEIYSHDFSIIGNDFKTADTIEELCDEVIVINNNGNHLHFKAKNFDFEDKDYNSFMLKKLEYKGIYGAIWTSKGLIYIAKLNDKGDLELL